MSVLIGQVSYAPRNELRTKRIEAAHYQIDFMHMLLPTATIVSVAQAYDASDYHPLARYRKYEQPIGAGAARNEILKIFYDSDYDWLLLCDDDTVLLDRYECFEFIHDVVEHPDKFKKIDAISALEPEYYPYKKLNFQDKANLTHYKFEPRVLNSGSATSIIRNMKKYYGVELYYPNVDANKGEGREDIEFLIDWLRHGFNWYTMQTMIRKSLCFDKSSIFGADTKARDKILMHDLDVICERYKDYGITRDVKGHITWKNFNERYNKSEKVLYIERAKPLEGYAPDEIPVKKDSSKRLF